MSATSFTDKSMIRLASTLRGLMLRGGAEYTRRVLVPLAPGRLRFSPANRGGIAGRAR